MLNHVWFMEKNKKIALNVEEKIEMFQINMNVIMV